MSGAHDGTTLSPPPLLLLFSLYADSKSRAREGGRAALPNCRTASLRERQGEGGISARLATVATTAQTPGTEPAADETRSGGVV